MKITLRTVRLLAVAALVTTVVGVEVFFLGIAVERGIPGSEL